MVEIVTRQNAHLYEDLLHDMHEMRYRVAVEQWGWRIPGIEPGYDKDDFDTEDTIYFVYPDISDRRALACGRLNPTAKPHMLSEVFAERCVSETLPRGEAIFEFSRYIVDHKNITKEEQTVVRSRIAPAINKFCLEAGITHLTFLGYMSSYARTVKYWETRPLGPPCDFIEDNATYIAAISTMNEEGLGNLRKAFGLADNEPHLSSRICWRTERAVPIAGGAATDRAA